jgi:peptidoglycan/LPS O-acetylase OafA/YrhL
MLNNSSQPKSQARMQYLDVLRGIAALTVAIGHIVLTPFDDWVAKVAPICNTGMFGVLLFFIISGFVITASILRADSLKSFWVARFWRLFPFYWVTLIISAAFLLWFPSELSYPQYGHLKDRFWLSFAMNLTMLQHFLKFDHFILAYWTLCFEMLFYISITIAALFKRAEKAYVGLWLITAYLTLSAILGIVGGRHFPFFQAVFLGYFFLGVWTHRQSKGLVTDRKYLFTIALFTGSLVSAWFVNTVYHAATPVIGQEPGHDSAIGNLVAYLGAIACFLAFHFSKRASYPGVLRLLGKVSYSLYLSHALAIMFGARIFDPKTQPILFLVAAGTLTVILTALGYSLVEAPCLRKISSLRKKDHASPIDLEIPNRVVA